MPCVFTSTTSAAFGHRVTQRDLVQTTTSMAAAVMLSMHSKLAACKYAGESTDLENRTVNSRTEPLDRTMTAGLTTPSALRRLKCIKVLFLVLFAPFTQLLQHFRRKTRDASRLGCTCTGNCISRTLRFGFCARCWLYLCTTPPKLHIYFVVFLEHIALVFTYKSSSQRAAIAFICRYLQFAIKFRSTSMANDLQTRHCELVVRVVCQKGFFSRVELLGFEGQFVTEISCTAPAISITRAPIQV